MSDKYQLADLINLEELKVLVANCSNLLNIPMGILDASGRLLVGHGCYATCQTQALKAKDCDLCAVTSFGFNDKAVLDGVANYKEGSCGLQSAHYPIVIAGKLSGELVLGQFFTETPQLELFKQRAKNLKLSEEVYLASVAAVPVLSFDYVEKVSKVWVQLAHFIAESGHFKRNQIASHRKLEKQKLQLAKLNKMLIEKQKALDRLNQIYEDATKLAKVGGWVLDVKHNQGSFTKQTYDIYGLPQGKVPTLEEAINFYHPDFQDYVRVRIQDTINKRHPYDIEAKFISGTDKEIWVHSKGKAITENGEVVKIIGAIQDITERKEIELELKKAQEIGGLGSWYLNLASGEVDWSEELSKIFGFDSNEKLPSLWEHQNLLDPLSWELLKSSIEHTRATGEAYDIELLGINKKNNEKRWVVSRGEAHYNTKGQIIGIRGIAQDITERKLTELALLESEKRLSNMAANIPGAIYQYRLKADGTDEMSFINPKCHELFEVSAEAVSENIQAIWDVVHPEDHLILKESTYKSGKNLDVWELEYRLLTPSGKLKWVSGIGRPEKQKNGDVVWDIIAIDITDKKQSELTLKDALKELVSLKNKYKTENKYLKEQIEQDHHYKDMIYTSPEISEVLNEVAMVAATNATVLLQGETGTGKEIVARTIHGNSHRKSQPLIKVNCAAIPKELIESELFGHKKGAFTGAIKDRVGKFQLAHGGTLFLDEIGELPVEMQPKLLRVLQEGEIEAIGGSKTIKVDVRIIAATNRNLLEEIGRGNFREDLFFRLNVFPLSIPPLRERKSDIPVLINHFVSQFSAKYRKKLSTISESDLNSLMGYDWPGNVRELENFVERAVIVSKDERLEFNLGISETTLDDRDLNSIGKTLDDVQKEHIIKTLKTVGWKISGKEGAAAILDLKPSTLRDRMKKLGIKRP